MSVLTRRTFLSAVASITVAGCERGISTPAPTQKFIPKPEEVKGNLPDSKPTATPEPTLQYDENPQYLTSLGEKGAKTYTSRAVLCNLVDSYALSFLPEDFLDFLTDPSLGVNLPENHVLIYIIHDKKLKYRDSGAEKAVSLNAKIGYAQRFKKSPIYFDEVPISIIDIPMYEPGIPATELSQRLSMEWYRATRRVLGEVLNGKPYPPMTKEVETRIKQNPPIRISRRVKIAA